jgi:Activator of Hsp90 ATPase homolog 1-like protein
VEPFAKAQASARADLQRRLELIDKGTEERFMNDQNLTIAFSVDQTPQEVFDAIINVRGWWTGKIEGSTDKLGDEFSYRYEDVHYSKQKLTEVVPHRKVVWEVLDADLSFAEDKSEWKGTKIIFEVSKRGDKTEMRFTHLGLVPDFECFDACSKGWGYYINDSLRKFIAGSQSRRDAN